MSGLTYGWVRWSSAKDAGSAAHRICQPCSSLIAEWLESCRLPSASKVEGAPTLRCSAIRPARLRSSSTARFAAPEEDRRGEPVIASQPGAAVLNDEQP